MLKKIKSHLELQELINIEGTEELAFVDLKTNEIIVCSEETEEAENWIRIPYREELCSYNEAVRSFVEEYDIDIPHNTKVMKFLRETDQLSKFYDLWNHKAQEMFSEWLLKHGIEINVA